MIKLIDEKDIEKTQIISRKKKYSDKELLDYFPKFVKENGRVPTCSDFNNSPEYPYVKTYRKRFGSWNKALELGLNIKRNKYVCIKYTNEELLDYPLRFVKHNGKVPTEEDFKNNPEYPSLFPYWKRFGGWLNALNLAGLV